MSDFETDVLEDYDIWFAEIERLAGIRLRKCDWTDEWMQGLTPEEALELRPLL